MKKLDENLIKQIKERGCELMFSKNDYYNFDFSYESQDDPHAVFDNIISSWDVIEYFGLSILQQVKELFCKEFNINGVDELSDKERKIFRKTRDITISCLLDYISDYDLIRVPYIIEPSGNKKVVNRCYRAVIRGYKKYKSLDFIRPIEEWVKISYSTYKRLSKTQIESKYREGVDPLEIVDDNNCECVECVGY